MFITIYWSSTPQKDERKIKWGAGKLVLEPRTGHNLVSRWVSEAKPYNEAVDRLKKMCWMLQISYQRNFLQVLFLSKECRCP